MNRIMLSSFSILLIAIVASCDGGGGIAGASWDSKKAIDEANSYQSYISPRLSEKIIKNQCSGKSEDTLAGISQHFDDILRSFSYNLERLELGQVELADFGLSASFGVVPITLSIVVAVRECKKLFERPNMICYPCGHCRGSLNQIYSIIWWYCQ